jgi:hypothetical protein
MLIRLQAEGRRGFGILLSVGGRGFSLLSHETTFEFHLSFHPIDTGSGRRITGLSSTISLKVKKYWGYVYIITR